MQSLKSIVQDSDTRAGRAFDLGVQILILASMVAMAVETLPGLSAAWRSALRSFELLTIAAFTVEYLLRLVTSDRPLHYATSFFGVIDLLAVLPSLIGLGADLRAIRALRLLRLFRLLKLARYSEAVRRYHLALKIAWEELVLFGALAAILVFLAAVGIYQCENQQQPEVFASIPHSLWWAIVTLTTVGYGDAYPVTAGGKTFTGLMLIIGLGIVSVPAGIVASALSRASDLQRMEESGNDNQSDSA